MSKNELRSSGEHRRCGFANGAGELRGHSYAEINRAAAESIADAVLRMARVNCGASHVQKPAAQRRKASQMRFCEWRS